MFRSFVADRSRNGCHADGEQLFVRLATAGEMDAAPRELLIKSAKNADAVLIQVRDSGKGLDPEQAARIFEPFFTTKPQGIGMGLSISRSIIESHGGRLWTVPGSSGALFQFTLPTNGNSVS
jgi:signal transduction histidine kinase